jgi:aubergine-like protein
MKLGTELNVFYYDVAIMPEVISDAYVVHGIFRNIKKKLDMLLGIHVLSGRSLFTTTDLDESICIKAEFKSQQYDVIIDSDSKRFISGKNVGALKMEDHSIVHNLINIIIKQAFRDTNLRQIGKAPRFFDVTRSIEVKNSGLQMWPGFRASAFNYQCGLALVIDNIFKFMSTTTCLERINDIWNTSKNPEAQILREFKGQSVIANWGNKKAYIVRDVQFTKNPVTKTFIDS